MELENTTPSEETTTIEQPESEITEAPTSEEGNTTEESNQELTSEESTPAYEPVMTYNFRKEEREIPELFKPIMTDEESNNLVKNYLERSAGMDFMKERRDYARNELETFRKEAEPKLQKYDDYSHFLEKGDLASARQVMGLTDEHVINEAIRLLEARELPESQRQTHSTEYALQQRELERQNQALQAQVQQQTFDRANFEYEQSVGANASIVNAYDEKFGASAFKTMVAQYGTQQEAMGRNISIQEAVSEVIDRYNLNSFNPQQETNNNINQTAPKTFPKVVSKNSGTSSPVAKNIQTFEDLQKLSDSIGA